MGVEGSMVSDMLLVAAAAGEWWLDNVDCEFGMRASMISQVRSRVQDGWLMMCGTAAVGVEPLTRSHGKRSSD